MAQIDDDKREIMDAVAAAIQSAVLTHELTCPIREKMDEAHDDLVELKTWKKTVHKDLYGNGQPGHIAVTNDFISSLRGQFRLLVVLISVVGVLVALLAFLEGNRQFHAGQLRIPNLGATDSTPVYAKGVKASQTASDRWSQ